MPVAKRRGVSAIVVAGVLTVVAAASAAGGDTGAKVTRDGSRPSAVAGIRTNSAVPSSKPSSDHGGLKRDRARPTAVTGIRMNSGVLSWKPSTDNAGVAGYEVTIGSRKSRVRNPMLRVRNVACGTVVRARIVAVDRAGNRSKAAGSMLHVSGCSERTPGWFGSFETGDLSQWDHIFAASPERFRVVSSDGGVIPRLGSHMARIEVRGGEPASWTAGANVAMAEKSSGPSGTGAYGADVYWGFSVYLPEGFPYVPNHFGNNIAEWHGNNLGQAPMHLTIDGIIGNHYGISNPRVGFVADLHLDPFTYRPQMWRLGNLVTGRWVDFVFRMKWHLTDGVYEGWMDGVKRFSYSGRTWPSATDWVKPQFGYYRANYARTAVLYLDAYKIGASYRAVAP